MNNKKKSSPLDDPLPFSLPNSSITPITSSSLIEQYNSCHLCGGALDFTHVTHFLDDVVTEEANCSNCMVKKKTTSHILQ